MSKHRIMTNGLVFQVETEHYKEEKVLTEVSKGLLKRVYREEIVRHPYWSSDVDEKKKARYGGHCLIFLDEGCDIEEQKRHMHENILRVFGALQFKTRKQAEKYIYETYGSGAKIVREWRPA